MVTQGATAQISKQRLRQMLLASRTEVDLALGDEEFRDCLVALIDLGVSRRLITDTLGYSYACLPNWLSSDEFSERERLYLTLRTFSEKVKHVVEQGDN